MPLDNDIEAPANEVMADFKMIVHPALRRGLSIHPVKPRGKEPWLNSWPKQATTDLTTVADWMKRFPTSNYGVAATDEFCILESDNLEELRNRISKQLPKTYMVQARENRPHIYFRQTPASRSVGNMDSPGIFEFKQNNRYVVGEGSIHPTGAVYACIEDAPIAEIPDWLITDLQRIRSGSGLKVSAPVPEGGAKYGEGEGRHPMLVSQAARMWDGQMSETEFFDKLQDLNLKHCDPPKTAAHVVEIVKWFMEREPVDKGPRVVIGGSKPEPEEPTGTETPWGVTADIAIKELAELPDRKGIFMQVGKDGSPDQVVFHEDSINQIFAWRGLGKTNLALRMARCFAEGGTFLDFRAEARRVVYVDGELPKRELYERARLFSLNEDVLLITPENLKPQGSIDLLNEEHFLRLREAIHRHIGEGSGVVILDSQGTLMGGDSMKTDFQERRSALLRRLRWMGLCVIEMHHSGKDVERQRGSSRNDDVLNVQIQLSPVPGWEPGMGLMFDWTYAKVRHHGTAPLEHPFTVEMNEGVWSKRVSDNQLAVVEELKKGTSIRKIAEELNMSTSTVQNWKRKAINAGLLELNEKANKQKRRNN